MRRHFLQHGVFGGKDLLVGGSTLYTFLSSPPCLFIFLFPRLPVLFIVCNGSWRCLFTVCATHTSTCPYAAACTIPRHHRKTLPLTTLASTLLRATLLALVLYGVYGLCLGSCMTPRMPLRARLAACMPAWLCCYTSRTACTAHHYQLAFLPFAHLPKT